MASIRSFTVVLYLFVLSFLQVTRAFPLTTASDSYPGPSGIPSDSHVLLPRERFILKETKDGLQAFKPGSQVVPILIPQGPATDGSGKDFDGPAILWIVSCFVIGIPMLVAGFRGWRLSTGVGTGITASLLAWASICNSIGPTGVSDLAILIIVLGFFIFGFILGILPLTTIFGTALLAINGGLAFGIQIILLKPGLLISGLDKHAPNWVIIGLLGLASGLLLLLKRTQRAATLFGCASIGAFLSILGLDLIINRQSGLSRGLRYLFDRNPSHIVDIVKKGYNPPASSQALLAVSLVLTFVAAYAQHRLFPQPFNRSELKGMGSEGDLSDDTQSQTEKNKNETSADKTEARGALQKRYFSGVLELYDSVKLRRK